MVFLIAPQNFSKSIWGRKISSGLRLALRKRRIHFTETTSTDAVSKGDTAFIFGSDISWLNAAVAECNALGLIPLLIQICDASSIISGQFHCISLDQDSILKRVISNPKTTVLFGVNELSCKDLSLVASFQRISLGGKSNDQRFSSESREDVSGNSKDATGSSKEHARIYFNRGSLQSCVDDLKKQSPFPETVLCANDFAAIILAKQLESQTRILSFGAMHLAKYYEDTIEKIPFQIEDLSSAAVSLMDYLEKQPQVSSVVLKIGGFPPQNVVPNISEEEFDDATFYSDPILVKMMNIENLLDECDETDLQVLRMLLSGETYEAIADACYINRSTLLYRMKKYFQICALTKKAELVEYLKEYLDF